MSENGDDPAAAAALNNEAVVHNNAERNSAYFKLPDFWLSTPHAWFGIAETQFRLRRVTSQEDRFGQVSAVLPESVARKISHLLSTPPVDCYTARKAAVLHSCQLTEEQKS